MDEQSSSVPLSLGSVAKRLTKQMLQERRKITTLKEQVIPKCMYVCDCGVGTSIHINDTVKVL